MSSPAAEVMSHVQSEMADLFRQRGFRKRNRTYNRPSNDGLVQVINFQMGRYDPPGTSEIPGMRENLYGYFTVNLGVFVPEVAELYYPGESREFIAEFSCQLRVRLGELGNKRKDLWWPLSSPTKVVAEIRERLINDGFSFLERFASRDAIVNDWLDFSHGIASAETNGRIIVGIILAKLGRLEEASLQLTKQVERCAHPGQVDHVKQLAVRLGLRAHIGH
jgi:Domain of unknown function (DUF4304)